MSRGNPKLLVTDGVVYLSKRRNNIELRTNEREGRFSEDLQYDSIMHADYTTKALLAASLLGFGNVLWMFVANSDFCHILAQR